MPPTTLQGTNMPEPLWGSAKISLLQAKPPKSHLNMQLLWALLLWAALIFQLQSLGSQQTTFLHPRDGFTLLLTWLQPPCIPMGMLQDLIFQSPW